MGSLNNSHHEQTGGVCVFNGELILLYCEGVNCELDNRSSIKGKLYLTTHRLIFTAAPLTQNATFKSFSAPFYAMFDLSLEQPIFGANYIKGKCRGEGNAPNFQYKLKFNKGGAIELGQAMSNAARIASEAARQTQFQPPPPYTPTASSYYQAPDNVYQPGYPIGFVIPTNIYPEAPPPGFIYTTQAPPPYPGLTPAYGAAAPPPPTNMYGNPNAYNPGFAVPPQQPSFNQAYQAYPNAAYPNTAYPNAAYPNTSYPNAAYPNSAYPSAPAMGEVPPSYDEATKKKE